MDIKNRINQVKYYYQKYGFFRTIKKSFIKVIRMIFGIHGEERDNYKRWIKNNEPTKQELEEQKNIKFEYMPKISIVVPMYNTPKNFFKELIECLIGQTYSNWELCLADGSPEINEKLKELYSIDDRIKYHFIGENKGISGNTNEALKLVTGDYIGLLDHDDLIPPFSLFEIVKCINENKDVEFIYTDEDKIENKKTKRCDPYFKPDFSLDTLRSNNYITHFSIFKKELMDKLGGFREKYNGAQDFDIILRMSENTTKIVHIQKVLYHWRVHSNSTAKVADAKPYAYEAGIKAIEDHLERCNLKATVKHGGDIPGVYEVQYDVIGNPSVSILIPNKDNINTLKTCINSILKLTTYDNYEIVIIENNSEEKETFDYYEELQSNDRIKIIYYQEKGFNYSKIINFGVKNVSGDYILQLNNDTELITPNWLEKMIGYAQRKDIGAVGARLYFKDKSIQHAGIAIGICGLAANLLTRTPYGSHAYFGKECLTQNVSAVTGACLFSTRKIYQEVGYMDEKLFAVAFNDVDFCLKIREKGYNIVYNPYVELMHYESITRGYELLPEKKERFEKECNNFKNKWKKVIEKRDPYFNKNFKTETDKFNINPEKIL